MNFIFAKTAKQLRHPTKTNTHTVAATAGFLKGGFSLTNFKSRISF
jgi:hypothetical protein